MTARLARLAALALTVALAAPSVATAPADPPVVVLPATRLTAFAGGKPHSYIVEIARTGEQQQRGLMYRRAMARDHGMIFPMSPPRPASFWMQNTYLPLDIVFIAPDGVVTNIGHGVPLTTATVDSLGSVSAVLELNAGEARRIGLKAGDKVRYKL